MILTDRRRRHNFRRCQIRKLGCFFGLILLTAVILTCTSLALIQYEHYVISQNNQELDRTTKEQLFPRFIHQIWFDFQDGSVTNHNPPPSWVQGAKLNRQANPDFMYKLWNEDEVIQLLKEDYPWFMDIYDSYPYDIQRVDVARYFIIHKYGGIYMDMDEIVNVPLREIIQNHNLTNYDCAFFSSLPSGISNHFIISKKKSPFVEFLISRLQDSNRWLVFPYATVMWSTGPRYVTARYMQYPSKESIFVFSRKQLKSYVQMFDGSTWHHWDGWLLNFAYPFLRLGGIFAAMIVFIVCVVLTIGVFYLRKSVTFVRHHVDSST